MLRERHRYGSSEVRSAPTSSRRRCSNRSGAVPEVGLIPGNRFLLLPLKKVTALVRPHTPCREPSATSTKPCISSRRSRAPPPIQTVAARSRHRRSTHRVAKAHLSPVSEHHEPLLDQVPRTRSRDTSIFTLSVEQAQLWRRSSNADLVRYRKPAGFRNNRVAPNYHPDIRSWSFGTDKVISTSNYYADLRSSSSLGDRLVSTDYLGRSSSLVSGSDRLVSTDYYGDLRSGGEKLLLRKRNSVAHHFRASSPFLCSFTNEHDLPFGPSPLHRRSGRSS